MPISQEKIQEHAALLNGLNALDYVPAAAEDNAARLQVIDREIGSRQQEVQSLEKKTKSEYKDLSRAKSTTRQWLLRIRQGEDAVAQKLEKEQKEYLDAFRAERDARDELAMLMGEKSERERAQRVELAKKGEQIDELKRKIESLYEGLFSGPTPGEITELGGLTEALILLVVHIDYPEEESAERHFKAVETEYHRTQTYLNQHTTAISLLIKAEKTISTCTKKLNEARIATAKLTQEDTLANMSEQLVQCSSLLSSRLTASIAQNLIRQADEACGGNAGAAVGTLDMVPSIPRTTEWDGEEFVTSLDGRFPAKLDECIRKLAEARTRLQGEIDKSSARIDGSQASVRQLSTKLQTSRKELADIRCRIMTSLTNPAALEAHPHSSAKNAHEVGDSDLPVYFDSVNTISGRPATDPSGNVSVGVPSYEESQAQNQPVGGFRVTLPRGNVDHGPTPVYAPSGSAPGPGGIGGFRVMAEPGWSPALSPRLHIPEAHGSPMPSPLPSPLSPKSPVVCLPPSTSSQAGPSGPRPISWSLNPYASAMIRRASLDNEGLLPPGGWMSNTNPFKDPGESLNNGH
ncbi:hypothetical protein RHS04_02517 [Rhizoctonia solani]|uniref:Uncharacterized protein n=1 Tax=Rhizoctonia solani TaxID=456999 RepID=A0A8H7HC02_9AGAM|nr:hypothetical protein RHS04_02517 [Rhizoctonia solani]